ncbi:hypothetical protein [Litoribaculum gwangyangense]|uniref:Lipoprotein n=1 Tax=Litoribaculum gwangyangense TaxID=1130722 RepID=A0ABP9BV53_9FLAO
MIIKILSAVGLLMLLVSCKKNQETSTSMDNSEYLQNQNITEQDIAKLKYTDYILDSKTEEVIKDWQEYYQLQDVINNVKKADLSFFNNNEENIKSIPEKLKESIPEELNSESILARLLVLETKLFKLESLSNLSTTSKEELLNTIKEFLVAFSHVNFQMNKKVEFDSRTIEKP